MRIRSGFWIGSFLIALLFASVVFSEESLIGSWVSIKKSNGGMASILEFQKEGTVASYVSIMMDYKYTLEGNKLTLKPVDENERDQKIFVVNLGDDELTMKPEGEKDAEIVILKRLSNHAGIKSKGITGQWVCADPTIKGKTEYYIFTADGLMLYRLPMPGRTITNFSVKGDMLEMSREDVKSTASKWQIKEGILTLSSQDGKEWSYKHLSPQEGHYDMASQKLKNAP